MGEIKYVPISAYGKLNVQLRWKDSLDKKSKFFKETFV